MEPMTNSIDYPEHDGKSEREIAVRNLQLNIDHLLSSAEKSGAGNWDNRKDYFAPISVPDLDVAMVISSSRGQEGCEHPSGIMWKYEVSIDRLALKTSAGVSEYETIDYLLTPAGDVLKVIIDEALSAPQDSTDDTDHMGEYLKIMVERKQNGLPILTEEIEWLTDTLKNSEVQSLHPKKKERDSDGLK